MIKICADCACFDGEFHKSFCTQEICPFCGKHLVSCGCMSQILALSPEEQYAVDAYIDDDVEPLKSINERWAEALKKKGRIPFLATNSAIRQCA